MTSQTIHFNMGLFDTPSASDERRYTWRKEYVENCYECCVCLESYESSPAIIIQKPDMITGAQQCNHVICLQCAAKMNVITKRMHCPLCQQCWCVYATFLQMYLQVPNDRRFEPCLPAIRPSQNAKDNQTTTKST